MGEPLVAAGRAEFGPPRAAPGAFLWSALQAPRALWWLLREPRLRALAVLPGAVTVAVGLGLAVAAVAGAGPLEGLLMARHAGLLAGAAYLAVRALLTLGLLLTAAMATWQLQGAIAGAYLERMALFVQAEVEGVAPPPATGPAQVVRKAALGVLPRAKGLLAWALSALAASTLILVPVAGPLLVLVAQAAIAAGFLAHGAIADNRERLGLPRWLLFKEPAAVLGLALGLAPLVLAPPVLLFAGGPVSVAGALVALGIRRRRALSPDPSPVGEGGKLRDQASLPSPTGERPGERA